jgi:hypothetical protein
VTALALLGTIPAAAQSPGPPKEEPLSHDRFGFKGTAIYKNFSFFRDTANDDRNFYNEGILQLEAAGRLASWLSAKTVVEGRADDNGYANGLRFEVPDRDEHRSYLDLKEAVLAFRAGSLRLTIGKQFFAWGTADGYSPTDNLNPYDYMDPIDREKMAVYSAAAQLTAGPASLTLAVIPLFTPSRSPLVDSRWFPPVSAQIASLTNARELPDTNARNMQYAARVRGTIAGWDLSASYFEGFENTPVIKQTAAVVAPGLVVSRLTPVFTRMQVAGADFSTTFGKLEVHGEAAAKFVVRDGRDDRFQGIAGINYEWDELGLSWLERIHVIVEYSREVVISSNSRSAVLSLDDLAALPNNGFRNALIGRALFRFNEDTQVEVGGTVNFDDSPNHYLKLALTHKLTDAIQVTTGIDLFNGSRDTFWGRWRDNDRFFFFLKYFF